MEAWVWLEREGLVAPKPGDSGNCVFVTRRGKRVATPEQLKAYRRANMLPKQLLHPTLAQKVWPAFLRGDYDTAVFQSFKEVEVRVREAGRFETTDLGVDLVRRAFRPGDGPLTDQNAPRPEQDALMHLAEVYVKMDERFRAQQALQQLIVKHPGSSRRAEAEKLLAQLR